MQYNPFIYGYINCVWTSINLRSIPWLHKWKSFLLLNIHALYDIHPVCFFTLSPKGLLRLILALAWTFAEQTCLTGLLTPQILCFIRHGSSNSRPQPFGREHDLLTAPGLLQTYGSLLLRFLETFITEDAAKAVASGRNRSIM